MGLTVVEVLERSKQGRTEPYLCRCDDDAVYFVKGPRATRRGLIAEWVCARLATELGLPIAPYAIAEVPDELFEADTTGWLTDLGRGAVFASQRVGAVEFSEAHRDLVAPELRRDVLAFDWWVQNSDRSLTERGGNPNLLWKPAEEALVVVDHNLAFDPAFDAKGFSQVHVFAQDLPQMFSDFLLRDAYASRFGRALQVWEDICATLPPAWFHIDPEQTIPVDFTLEDFRSVLDRALQESFWELPA